MPTKERGKLIQELGGTEKVLNGLARFSEQVSLLNEQREELTQKHPKHWIAFFNGTIQAIEKDFDAVAEKLEAANIPLRESAIEFLDTEKRILIM